MSQLVDEERIKLVGDFLRLPSVVLSVPFSARTRGRETGNEIQPVESSQPKPE